MGAILTGTIIYFVIWVLAAFLIQEKVTRDEKDEKLIKEYRG
jgi:hypothetical protein